MSFISLAEALVSIPASEIRSPMISDIPESKPKEVVVKVQVPLKPDDTIDEDAPALVYAEGKEWIRHIAVDDELIHRLHGRPKLYLLAHFVGAELVFGKEVPNPGW